jgi:S1-C subfamily serine protease
MARKNIKTMFSSLVLAFIIVVGAVVGGFYYLIHLLVKDYYEPSYDPNLDSVIEQTKEHEGFCLTDIAQENNLNIAGLSEFYKDACVSIIVTVNDTSAWLGSGVCVASKGYEYATGKTIEEGSYIVTNYHVIEEIYGEDVTKFTVDVYPNEYDNTERYGTTLPYPAQVLWSDQYLDGAILYVSQNIDWVRMKDRTIACYDKDKLKDRERAFVIGSPKQIENQNTVTTGTISNSALNYSYTVDTIKEGLRDVEVLSNVYEYLIPIQIQIAGGNSGGGLFDSNGYLVGQPTLGSSEDAWAINYAIPIYSATLVLNDLVESNEGEGDLVKIYSIDYFNIAMIDHYEADVMKECFSGASKYFYGKYYLSQDLLYSREEGLKVLTKNEELGFEFGDIILSVTINEIERALTSRNDLIYELLRCRKGDVIQFNIEDKAMISVKLA